MYDVFISFKNRDKEENLTEDSRIAEEIYRELTNRNIDVFFSNHEIEIQGESEWRKAIDKALDEAGTLILVGTSEENIYSGQVDYEWEKIFMEEIISRKKPDGRIVGYFKGINIKTLPQKLQNQEIFDVVTKTVGELCDFVERRLPEKNIASKQQVVPNNLTLAPTTKYNKRFHYAAGYTNLVGREKEIDFLKKFCLETNYLLSWTVIDGKGGVGKSKLAYDFCRIIESYNWIAFTPIHAKSFSKENLMSISRDAVVCFDYAKFELEYVEEIMQFIIDQKIRHKLRIILIERDGTEVGNGFSSKIGDYHYPEGDLRLIPLEENALISLIEDYTKSIDRNKSLEESDIKNILEALSEVDPGVCRPLFAMFITDAWVDGNLNLQDWDRDSAVKYVANKELDRIDTVISNYSSNVMEKKQYEEALYTIVAYTTFVGGTNITEVLNGGLLNPTIPEEIIRQLLIDSDLLKDGMINGIEPDLIGEYVCIKILSELGASSVDKFFSNLYENQFSNMIEYFDKIYDDYTDVLLSASWSKFATDIELPTTFSYVRKNMFNGCGFIHEIKLHDGITTISKGAFRDCDHLRKINFPDNLEVIDSVAFINCVALEMAVPDDEKGWAPSIISIGDRAFKNCRKIKEIRIPRSVKEIGAEAFAKCSALESITIPGDVTVVAHNTFELCTSLYEVEFTYSKEGISIQSEAFRGCSLLKKLTNSKRIAYIGKAAFENCKNLKRISLGDKLTEIGESAFKGCSSLMIMDLSASSIRRINKSVFEKCENLEKVVVPNTLSYIATKGFAECYKLNDIQMPETIRNIGDLAFYGCNSLNIDSFGENIKNIREFCAFYVKEISNDFINFATSYYDEKNIVLPSNVYRIGEHAFLNDRNLENITFHSGIMGIGKEAFRGCVNLRIIDGSLGGIKSIGQGAFLACKALEHLPSDTTITEIAESTFRFCTSLKEIKFNSGIEKIGKSAFSQCYSLQRLDFKGKCSCISSGAFSGCVKFFLSEKYHVKRKGRNFYVCGFIFNRLGREELYFISKYTEWETVRIPFSCIGFFENPFENTKVKKVYIPNSVRTLIKCNFANTQSLVAIRLPRQIHTIPESTFENCQSLKIIEMAGTEENNLRDGLRIGRKAFAGCASLEKIGLPVGIEKIEDKVFLNCKSLQGVALNDGLKLIGNAAFAGCESLASISLPASVEYIGCAAFKDCTNLEVVYGLDGTKISTLENETFMGCHNLEEIKLPKDLTSIGPYVFYDCKSLEEIDVFSTNVSYIGIAAFQNCYMLRECTLPGKVKKIEKFTFKSCTQLKRIKMSPDIEEIGLSAFFGCNMLNNIKLHNKQNLKTLGNDAFSGCHRIETMEIPSGVSRLPRGLFRGCVSLRTVVLPEQISTISVDCFKDCKQLNEIKISGKVNSVGAGAFRNCFALKDISFLENITHVEVAAFRGCTSIENAALTLVDEIPVALFMGCYCLRSVSFPQVRQIDNYAFYGCKELVDAPIEKIKFRIGDGAFWNCCKLNKVNFSETMFDIQPSAFRNCESIEKISFPNGIQRIYAASFRGASGLTTISIPETVKEIHKSAFRECSNLEAVDINSEDLMIEGTAFGDCRGLCYFNFGGQIKAQQTAFEGTPMEQKLLNDERIQWVEKTSRANTPSGGQTEGRNISASKAADMFLYRIQDGGICLERYIGKDKIVDIPDTINGISVEHIGDGCFEDRRDLLEIKMPQSILTIGDNSFAGCRSMTCINLPENIISIGAYAFKWCSELTTIHVPQLVDDIKSGTFMCCVNLDKIDIPCSIKKISEGAFWRCGKLSAKIPDSVEDIETGAFKGVNPENVDLTKKEKRYFEEWPFDEMILSETYGKGKVIKCDFVNKTQYMLEIMFDIDKISVSYPDEFDKGFRFATDEGVLRHIKTIEKMKNYELKMK